MKNGLYILLMIILAACTRTGNGFAPVPFTNTNYLGRWNMVAKQSPGIGGFGIWSAAPAGQYMTIDNTGQVGGNTFTDVTGYQVVDSVTIKFIAPSQPAGFYLFNYKLDTVAKAFFFYIRVPDGTTMCIEGCGGYRFER